MSKFYLKFITFFFFSLTIILLVIIMPEWTNIFNFTSWQDILDDKRYADFIELISLIISFSITILSLIKVLTSSLFDRSEKSADTFLKLAHDPMDHVKSHFKKLIHSIKQPVIVYIDDLDRCNPYYVVTLLEGIETLFKETQLYYLVAADRQWIAQCFEIKYERFKEINNNDNTKLGYKFLQKMFQFSVRLPHISDKQKNAYWKYILKIEEHVIEEDTKEIETIFSKLKTEDEVNYKIKELKKEGKVPEGIILKGAISRLIDKDFEGKTEHILMEHSIYLDSNPRSIKRLANYYNVSRNTLILEGQSYNKSVIIRWLVLNEKFPLIVERLEQNPSTYDKLLDETLNKEGLDADTIFLRKLINGENNDPKLTKKDIMNLTGVY